MKASYGPSGGVKRRFEGGEPADVIALDSKLLDDLIKQGKVRPGPTDIARTGIGIAVKKGAPKPDVSSADALKGRCSPPRRSATPRQPAAASPPCT